MNIQSAINLVSSYLFGFESNPPKKIQVISKINQGGLGDLLCGMKLTDHLVKNFPTSKITMHVEEKNLETCRTLAKNRFNISIKLMPKNSNDSLKLRINIPAGEDIEVDSLPQTCLWQIEEYGGGVCVCDKIKPKQQFVLGLAKNQIGIFIDSDLRKFANQFKNDEPVQSPEFLNELSHKELKEKILNSQDTKNYFQKNQLFFSYLFSPCSLKNALCTFAKKEQLNQQRNVDIVIPSKRLSSQWGIIHILDFFAVNSPYFQALDKMNYGSLEIHWYDQNEKKWNFEKKVLNPNNEKEIRLFIPSMLENEDMHRFIKCSDDLVFITGDQTLSEAISAGKTFCYETLNHKKILAKQLSILMNSYQKLHDFGQKGIFDEHDTIDFESLAEQANDPSVREAFKLLNNQLSEKNALNFLIEKIKFWHKGFVFFTL